MKERPASLEETLKTSVGGPCAFPEELSVPVVQAHMKLENRGANGDSEDDLRFETHLKRTVEKHEITEEEAQKLLLALKN